jgi:hypothetical protein
MPTVGGTLTVASAAGPALVARSQSANNTLTYASKASADTFDRFTVNADGMLQWGPGNAAVDVSLYRNGVNQLRTDDMLFQTYAGGAAIADQNAALNMSISGAPTTPFGGMYGVLATATAQPQATTWSAAYGMFSQVTYAGSGASTLSTLAGMYTRAMMSGASPAGTVTQAISLFADGPQSQASGTPAVTFTNQYGIFIGNQASPPAGMTIGTSYGLYITNQTGAAGNLWAIYSAGGKSAHAGSITIGAITNPAFTLDVTGTGHFSQILRLGGVAAQATTPVPLMSAVAGGNGIEFGHSNTAGYRSTIGAELASGRPFIAFSCAHGTTNNTFITQGFQGSVFQGDLVGGFSWNNIPVATAGTDNQVRVQTMTLSASGALTLPLAGIVHNGNITFSAAGSLVMRNQAAIGTLSLASRLTADTQDRFTLTTDGTMTWGPGGSTTTDTTLARTGVATLTLTARTIISDPASASSGLTLTQSGLGDALHINYSSPAGGGHAINIAANNPGTAFAMIQMNQANAAGNATYYISAQRTGFGGVFAVDGNGVVSSTSGSITVLSSAVLKDEIETLPNPLEALMALKPRKWKWSKSPYNHGREGQVGYGLVVEEVENVLPHLVGEWNMNQGEESTGGKMKTLAMGELVPFLLGAVQELTKRLEVLESKT